MHGIVLVGLTIGTINSFSLYRIRPKNATEDDVALSATAATGLPRGLSCEAGYFAILTIN